MIDTILLDLDGTLLHFSQEAFVNAYLGKLGKLFAKLGMDAEGSVKIVWAGTKAMLQNDGGCTNAERFWAVFAEQTGLSGDKLQHIKDVCDDFYINEFDTLKALAKPDDTPKRLVYAIAAKGFTVALATNPLFPMGAVATRLGWIGLKPQDFSWVTHYENSTFCKPSPGYYREVLHNINKKPEQCLMAGNNPVEDMSAGELGIQTFLVTDCLENEANVDISAFRSGTLKQLEEYVLAKAYAYADE
jgi:FMN phosphatase YigB (HAD superfamily)